MPEHNLDSLNSIGLAEVLYARLQEEYDDHNRALDDNTLLRLKLADAERQQQETAELREKLAEAERQQQANAELVARVAELEAEIAELKKQRVHMVRTVERSAATNEKLQGEYARLHNELAQMRALDPKRLKTANKRLSEQNAKANGKVKEMQKQRDEARNIATDLKLDLKRRDMTGLFAAPGSDYQLVFWPYPMETKNLRTGEVYKNIQLLCLHSSGCGTFMSLDGNGEVIVADMPEALMVEWVQKEIDALGYKAPLAGAIKNRLVERLSQQGVHLRPDAETITFAKNWLTKVKSQGWKVTPSDLRAVG